jgi:NAD(P)H-flavin reductase
MNPVNPYLPSRAQILNVFQETHSPVQDVKTYTLKLESPIDYSPGQFVEVTIPGTGEAPFGFASSPHIKDTLQLCIKRAGYVTDAFHRLQEGDYIWLRGPFGNTFPMSEMEGYNLFYVAGGLGLAPLRPLIDLIYQPENRPKYGKINMLIAARSTNDFVFKYDYEKWAANTDTDLKLTIDNPEPGWDGLVGFPHNLVKDIPFDIDHTYAVLCGPPVMIKALTDSFIKMGMPKNRILTTLEMRMTCGVGKCGKCNIGHQYVCIDGPVFSMAELDQMPNEY